MVHVEQSLVAVLTEQIRCAEAMLGTLSEENKALVDGDAERLNSAGADKVRLVATLEALESERRALAAAIETALGADERGETNGKWQSLLQLIAACKQQNQRNGALVKVRTEQVRAALKVLRGAEPQVYDPRGLSPSSQSKRSLGSA